jgi:hypothetical protein
MTAPRKAVSVRLTGYIVAWTARGPATLRGHESGERYLPVFSSAAKLADFATRSGWPYVEVKKIKNGHEFLDLVPADLVVIVDPHFTAKGRVRYGRRILD